MVINDRHGLPLAVYVVSVSPHETRLVDATLAARFIHALPARLIGDRGYNSAPLDAHPHDRDHIKMTAAHRPHRRFVTQDGRPLQRARRRWKNRTPLCLVL